MYTEADYDILKARFELIKKDNACLDKELNLVCGMLADLYNKQHTSDKLDSWDVRTMLHKKASLAGLLL